MDFNKPSATPLKFLLDEINFQRTKELMRQSLREGNRIPDGYGTYNITRIPLITEGGFVMLPGANTFWTDLFVRHFLFETDAPIQESDDLLFFVRYKHVKGSSRINPKYEVGTPFRFTSVRLTEYRGAMYNSAYNSFQTDIDVFRKDSRKLPIGDPEINWEETVYLNLVIHQFDYKLTLAICTR